MHGTISIVRKLVLSPVEAEFTTQKSHRGNTLRALYIDCRPGVQLAEVTAANHSLPHERFSLGSLLGFGRINFLNLIFPPFPPGCDVTDKSLSWLFFFSSSTPFRFHTLPLTHTSTRVRLTGFTKRTNAHTRTPIWTRLQTIFTHRYFHFPLSGCWGQRIRLYVLLLSVPFINMHHRSLFAL